MELRSIFDPINKQLLVTKSRAVNYGLKSNHDSGLLDAYFQPILQSHESVSSIILADEDGNEYMLSKTDSSFVTKTTSQSAKKSKSIFYSWSNNSEGRQIINHRWEADTDYDVRERPWFQTAISSRSDTTLFWTSPYIFYSSKKPGITASIKWNDPASNKTYIYAIDVLISDLSEFTTQIDVTEHGKVFILSNQLDVIGLPNDGRFKSKQDRNRYTLTKLEDLGIPVLDTAITQYRSDKISSRFLSFRFDNQIWWSGVDVFKLNESEVIYLGVVVPESDFSKDLKDTRRALVSGIILALVFLLSILYSFIRMKKANKIIKIERDKNQQLLLNTLPVKVVNELKENGWSEPQKFSNVTFCFADIVEFTRISSALEPKELISELNTVYTAFDEIMVKNNCERIKTIGDTYMAVSGMPEQNKKHAELMLNSAFEMVDYLNARNLASELQWQMRIGLHSGNVVGGIVGVKKYIYDVFGDAINTAFRMESHSEPMRINISESTFSILKERNFPDAEKIVFTKRESIEVKGKGKMTMYFASRQ